MNLNLFNRSRGSRTHYWYSSFFFHDLVNTGHIPGSSFLTEMSASANDVCVPKLTTLVSRYELDALLGGGAVKLDDRVTHNFRIFSASRHWILCRKQTKPTTLHGTWRYPKDYIIMCSSGNIFLQSTGKNVHSNNFDFAPVQHLFTCICEWWQLCGIPRKSLQQSWSHIYLEVCCFSIFQGSCTSILTGLCQKLSVSNVRCEECINVHTSIGTAMTCLVTSNAVCKVHNQHFLEIMNYRCEPSW